MSPASKVAAAAAAASTADEAPAGAKTTAALAQGASLLGRPRAIPSDPMEELIGRMMADGAAQKVNLTVGAYRDDEGRPWVLPTVRKVEQSLVDGGLTHEYVPFTGLPGFAPAAARFAFGTGAGADEVLARTSSVQALSGTGALRLGGQFLGKFLRGAPVYLSDPSWVNHRFMFDDMGFEVRSYRYFDRKSQSLDLAGMLEDLGRAPEGAIVILHACAHNPTGTDPSHEQWAAIAELVVARRLFAFFDCAYQGYATGDPDADAWAIRHFASKGVDMAVAQSFSKIAGLYGERVGALSVVTESAEMAAHVTQQLKSMIRMVYLSPPTHGARIVKTIFESEELTAEWKRDIATMNARIQSMRARLVARMEALETGRNWAAVGRQKGMFAFTELTREEVERLEKDHHIYMTGNGRISLAGLNDANLEYVAKAIAAVMTEM